MTYVAQQRLVFYAELSMILVRGRSHLLLEGLGSCICWWPRKVDSAQGCEYFAVTEVEQSQGQPNKDDNGCQQLLQVRRPHSTPWAATPSSALHLFLQKLAISYAHHCQNVSSKQQTGKSWAISGSIEVDRSISLGAYVLIRL
jgi:hypothetical protein